MNTSDESAQTHIFPARVRPTTARFSAGQALKRDAGYRMSLDGLMRYRHIHQFHIS